MVYTLWVGGLPVTAQLDLTAFRPQLHNKMLRSVSALSTSQVRHQVHNLRTVANRVEVVVCTFPPRNVGRLILCDSFICVAV
jgi:hypothetical protein